MAGIIDPELLAAHEDPSLRFLAQLNTADPSPPLEGSDFTDFDDEDLMDPSDLSGIKDVSALMKRIKHRKKLTNEANTKLDTYAQVRIWSRTT